MLRSKFSPDEVDRKLFPLLDKYCRVNAYEEDGDLDDIVDEIAEYVYIGDLFATINWYWNTQYLKSMTDSEWVQWFLFRGEARDPEKPKE